MAQEAQSKGKDGGGNRDGGSRRWPWLVSGLALGFLAGWWFPAPRALHFDEFRTSTNQRLAAHGRRLQNHVADLTESLGRNLHNGTERNRPAARSANHGTALEALQPANAEPDTGAAAR